VISGRASAWSAGSVGQLVTNRAVLGEYAPHQTKVDAETGKRTRVPDGEPVPNMYPPMIPAALYLKVQRDRQKRRNPTGPRGESVSNLYTGLLRCGCGATVHLLAKRPGVKHLTCSARIAGSKCGTQAWEYSRTERMLLALLHRVDEKELIVNLHAVVHRVPVGVAVDKQRHGGARGYTVEFEDKMCSHASLSRALDVARVSFLFGLFGPQRWTLSAHDEISESSEST
jgi:hypothetical protein